MHVATPYTVHGVRSKKANNGLLCAEPPCASGEAADYARKAEYLGFCAYLGVCGPMQCIMCTMTSKRLDCCGKGYQDEEEHIETS